MAQLEFNDVTKMYGDIVAVKDISLTISDNEFFCIFGPPSCGKTTLLRLLLGLVQQDTGSVLIGGKDVTEVGPQERDLAMVFQNLALFPHMTAYENLAFPLVERKVSKADIKARIGEVAETLHITPLLKKIPAHLSGGERQRVAIGRALVRDPAAFLMDEPIAALDARLREEMRGELKRLQRELNHTLVYVTHDQEEAMSIADRMAIMEDGRIRQVGTPDEIYNHPNGRYVAELIGSPPMNFIDGAFDGSSKRFSAGDFEMSIGFEGVSASGAASIGVRPEDFRVTSGGGAEIEFDANVYEVEPLGGFTIVDCNIGEKVLKVQIPGQPTFELGQAIKLGFDSKRAHLFDGPTGDVLASAA
ncbi:MAG: ABC transporter ATP-binding protein [Rhodospirillaceae bacterium]|nr:ABC transporter ATP-binding protein [Rhodospirillaceae bacterium]